MLLTKEKILSAQDSSLEKVDVLEWGGHVFIRTMSGTERDQFENESYNVTPAGPGKKPTVTMNRENFRARLLVRCVADESGQSLFTRKDIEALGKKSAKALDRLYDVAQRVNGLTPEDVEELTKN